MGTAQLSKLRRAHFEQSIAARREISFLISLKRHAEFAIFCNESVQPANQPDYGKVGQHASVALGWFLPSDDEEMLRYSASVHDANADGTIRAAVALARPYDSRLS
jgi:hypothetical protein